MAAFLSISDLLIAYRAGATAAFRHRYGRPACPLPPHFWLLRHASVTLSSRAHRILEPNPAMVSRWRSINAFGKGCRHAETSPPNKA